MCAQDLVKHAAEKKEKRSARGRGVRQKECGKRHNRERSRRQAQVERQIAVHTHCIMKPNSVRHHSVLASQGKLPQKRWLTFFLRVLASAPRPAGEVRRHTRPRPPTLVPMPATPTRRVALPPAARTVAGNNSPPPMDVLAASGRGTGEDTSRGTTDAPDGRPNDDGVDRNRQRRGAAPPLS